MKIVLAPEAVDDLPALVEYLHQRNPQAALATADGIFRVIDRLAAQEFEGPECELRRTREPCEAGRRGHTASTTGAKRTASSFYGSITRLDDLSQGSCTQA